MDLETIEKILSRKYKELLDAQLDKNWHRASRLQDDIRYYEEREGSLHKDKKGLWTI